jgi:2-amino-4-hydroxy-6-hydroxymethyldihydropteridine diphosphokinase
MKTYRVFLGLGSNLGDRRAMLQSAVRAVGALPGTLLTSVSHAYETDPFGRKDQPVFLNAALEFTTGFAPDELMPELRRIERELGRTEAERWAPRCVDLDILLYDGLTHETADLIVPHPGLPGRRFVLVPLCDIAPDVVHPVSGMTMEELLRACSDDGRVVRSVHHLLIT